jgi:hypothetical protein
MSLIGLASESSADTNGRQEECRLLLIQLERKARRFAMSHWSAEQSLQRRLDDLVIRQARCALHEDRIDPNLASDILDLGEREPRGVRDHRFLTARQFCGVLQNDGKLFVAVDSLIVSQKTPP